MKIIAYYDTWPGRTQLIRVPYGVYDAIFVQADGAFVADDAKVPNLLNAKCVANVSDALEAAGWQKVTDVTTRLATERDTLLQQVAALRAEVERSRAVVEAAVRRQACVKAENAAYKAYDDAFVTDLPNEVVAPLYDALRAAIDARHNADAQLSAALDALEPEAQS